jgi:hypothetical protein
MSLPEQQNTYPVRGIHASVHIPELLPKCRIYARERIMSGIDVA